MVLSNKRLREFSVSYSSVRQVKSNTSYPFIGKVTCELDLSKIAEFDHAGPIFSDGKNKAGNMVKGYRSNKTFQRASVVIMDCDNSTSNPLVPDIPEEEWVTPSDVQKAFPGVPFYIVYSRHHLKSKDGKAPRPKFHVYFPVNAFTSEAAYGRFKRKLQEFFPAFDSNALVSSQGTFGVENPTVEYYEGTITVDEFIASLDKPPEGIPIGRRNATLSRQAAKIIKRYGDTEKARDKFNEMAARCEVPLTDSELDSIWRSAQKFYHETVVKDPKYKSPETFSVSEGCIGGDNKKPLTIEDIKAILKEMKIRVRLNEISGKAEIDGMPEKYSRTNAVNVLPVLIEDFVKAHSLKCSKDRINDCLTVIMDENRFNPVKEMLDEVEYDGIDRITEIKKILGIEYEKQECIYLTKWLHQTVAIAFNDENKPFGADGVLVLQGNQGAGKTLFCSKIALSARLFAEGVSIDMNNKDSVIQSTGVWIAELGELDSTLKREQSALKAFLTARQDTYRMPYAKAPIDKPRRTSFCATVNPEAFLNDESGSRRFWVIHPKKIDVKRLLELSSEWIKQMWRQVYEQLYLPNPQGFRLTAEEREILEASNAKYEKPLPGEIEVMETFAFVASKCFWRWRRTTDVMRIARIRGVSASQVGKVLSKLAKNDSRVECKSSHHVNYYLLPPEDINHYQFEDDANPFE